MVSLVDIVPQTQTVRIAAGELELRGLGLRHVAALLLAFPELRKFFAENAPALDAEAIIAQAPDAVGTIIAEAAGQPEAAGHITEAMGLDDVFECLEVVIGLTMPNGLVPFMDRLTRVLNGGVALAGLPGRDQPMNSPPLLNN